MAVSNISDLARELAPYILPYIPTPTTSSSGSALGGTSGSYLALTDWYTWKSAHENSSNNPHPQYLLSARQVLPGYGLTGGGALTADVTLTVDAANDASISGNYGKVLKSTGTGGLTLAALQVNGAINTTGNITAGSNVIFVNVSGSRVGINCAADPQFQLDVAGNIRAQGYIVGRHAIQLEGALLIAHYDGKENDLTGEANGHKGQVAAVYNTPTFQAGKFNKAIAIAEATTNLVSNSDFESGITGWSGGAGGSVNHNGDKSWLGKFSLKASLPNNGYAYYPVTCPASTTYTYSAYLWCDTPATVNIQLTDTIAQSLSSGSISIPAKRWTRINFTGTTNANTARWLVITNVTGSTKDIWIDGAQIEAKAYLTPYTAGSRSACGIRYLADGNLDRGIGTVMAWVNFGTGNNASNNMYAFKCESTVGSIIISSNAGAWYIAWGTTPVTFGTVTLNTWTHVALVNDGVGGLYFYVNGTQVYSGAVSATISSVPLSGSDLYMAIGCATGFGDFAINGMIDELAISDIAQSADAIKAIYESNAPVFAESSTFSFRIPKSTVWADENGLFVLSDTGAAVFGAIAYTGGYSWGGQTLQAGDILMGTGTSYAKWDQTTTTFKVAGNIDAQSGSISGVLSIGAAGGIYQGTGSFASPTTGLKIRAAFGIGMIEGYSSGSRQWYADTDGLFYAGGGNTQMSSTGFRFNASTAYAESASLSTYWSGTKIQNVYATRDDAPSPPVVRGYIEAVGPSTHNTRTSLVATQTSSTQTYLQVIQAASAGVSGYDFAIEGALYQRHKKTYWEVYTGGTGNGGKHRIGYFAAGSVSGFLTVDTGSVASVGGSWTVLIISSSGVKKVFTGSSAIGTGTYYTVDAASDFFVGFDGSNNPYWSRAAGARTYEVAMELFYF